jgi:putative colanic acid biosynthesis UDP-glucose lipid carrier transferase
MFFMERKTMPGNLFHQYTDLSIIREEPVSSPSHQSVASIINVESITTPFANQPLDIFFNKTLKRSFDIVFSILIITFILSWLIPIIAILIWIDSKGPVFFLQKRNKRNGKLFTCVKFRSMIVNADADILPAGPNDKRITSFGHFLRDHYIDELPQFFNVLFGDMSVIGPRPHMVSDDLKYEEQIEHYANRYNVKPGITGLAQVLGYVGAIEDINKMTERVNLDIFYQRHWSIKLDVIIIWRTILKPFHLSRAKEA